MIQRQHLFAYGAALLTLLVVDGLWLTVLMGETYKSFIGPLMLAEPNWTAAALFYLLYPAGLVLFAASPALAKRSLPTAAVLGACFGLVAYGTYDLSNLATLRGWPWPLTVIDMAWGTSLSGLAASVAYFAGRR